VGINRIDDGGKGRLVGDVDFEAVKEVAGWISPVPGGVGLASRLFDERESLLRKTRVLLDGCACDEGCPACVGPGAVDAVHRGRKSLALAVLSALGVTALC
jgi:hypothetical protein